MKSYNIVDGTVTLTIPEFLDLVRNATRFRYLERYGVDCWEGYDEAMSEMSGPHDYSLDELTAAALAMMLDEERSDYELMVASEWLRYLPLCHKMKVAEWAAIMRDLEVQLKAIIEKENN